MRFNYWLNGSTIPYTIEASTVQFNGMFVSFWNGPLLVKAVTNALRVEPEDAPPPQDDPEPEPDPPRHELANLKTIRTHLGQLASSAAGGTEALRHYRTDVPALLTEVEVLRDRQRR